MAPKKISIGTIIILDTGRNVSTPDEKEGRSFFQEARECAARIIERKVISMEKNLLGIILLGSKKTKNSMAEQCDGAFRRIELLHELQTPSWQMIRDLPEEPSKYKGDWFDSLIVAADHFKNGISGYNIANKKIILMTNFKAMSDVDHTNVQEALNGFGEENFEVDVIGTDLSDCITNNDIELARQFVDVTDGTTASFENTMRYLLFHKKKVVNAAPWNVDLSIGPNVRIPVSSYIRIKDEPAVKNWMKAIKDPVSSTASTSEGIFKQKEHFNSETQTSVTPENITKGYQYGQKIIPFSDCDKAMLYQSGDKSLSVYGFTKASNVKWQNLNGDGLSYVFGRKGDEKSHIAVRCLVECLHELNLVGIVRKVHNNNNTPKMYVLMPVVDPKSYVCLSMINICYKDDIKNMSFPNTNLKRYDCSDEQVNAFKDLIKAMDLTNAYDDTFDDAEAFPIAETVSPSAQYILDCIAFRAMNPGKLLPQPRDDIMMLFKTPPLLEKRAKEPLEKIKTLFKLIKVEKVTKERKRKQSGLDNTVIPESDIKSDDKSNLDIPIIQMPVVTKKVKEILRVGTVEPINDFVKLKEEGNSLSDLFNQMTESIESLIYCNLNENLSKAYEAMSHLRSESVKDSILTPLFNNWLKNFKSALTERKRSEVLDQIIEKKLNFIVKEENNASTYDSENADDSQYDNDTIPNSTEVTMQSEINDFFDEM